jgi:putative transposase
MARGIERRDIFHDDTDRGAFVQRLGDLVQKTATAMFAWSLMPNHLHLLVRTADFPLSKVMRRLLGGYAGAFNRRHHRCGHLFQNRFKSILVEEERYPLELVRYIQLNPVRGGIVRSLEDLDEYPWTGHAEILNTVILVAGTGLTTSSRTIISQTRKTRSYVPVDTRADQLFEVAGHPRAPAAS